MAASEAAPAKINLSLKVHGRRPDGYHELESLVVFADCGDRLSGHIADDLGLDIRGPFAAALADDPNNLVLRAAHLLGGHLGRRPGAHLTLEKNLPVASGIGGGSADAAAALRLLSRLWEADLSHDELSGLAIQLGADVPVCLDIEPAMMRGAGEKIRRFKGLPRFWLVLANPRVALPTANVFKMLAAPRLSGRHAEPAEPDLTSLEDLVFWLRANGNDLEAPALKIAPVIAETIAAIDEAQGCLLARMSGSGATCFGIFGEEGMAKAVGEQIAMRHPAWWVASAAVLSRQ